MHTGGVLKITDIGRDRYSRLRLIPWWEQGRLENASIMVAGMGALGNEVAKNLAQLGIGSLFLVDFDYVETSNLTRSVLFREEDEGQKKVDVAACRLAEINPDVRIYPFHGDVIWDIGLGVFRRMDVVIGCLDNREARLAINRACWKVSKPWVNGAIQELMGTAEVFIPPKTACYECNFTEMDYRLINLRYSCPLLKREDIITGKIPTVPTISSIIGGLQVQEALKILHGMGKGGVGYTFAGMTNNFFTSEYSRNERCMSHETYGKIVELNETSKKLTPRKLLEIDGSHNGLGIVELDREIVCGLKCKKCGRKCDIMKPLGKVTMNDGTCKSCGSLMDIKMTHTVRADDGMADMTIAEIGLPLLHIIAVRKGRSYNYYEVTGDMKRVFKKREVR